MVQQQKTPFSEQELMICHFFIRYVWVLFLAILSCHLDYQPIEFRRGEKYLEEKKFAKALVHYEKAMSIREGDLSVRAASQAAWLSYFHLKKFQKALNFYRYVVVHSDSQSEKISSQEKIVNIYFDKLADYKSSLSEISRLLKITQTDEKRVEYELKLAKSYFYLGDFKQAQVEVEATLSRSLLDRRQFEALSLKGDIYLTAKKLKKAVEVYRNLQRLFPKWAHNKKVGLNIAACYEEMDELDLAITELKKVQIMGPRSELIDKKIKRLAARRGNLPGAQGLGK